MRPSVYSCFSIFISNYRITDTTVKCKGDGTTSLWRRYSEFELLRNYLEITYPALVVPPLPEKKVNQISLLQYLCLLQYLILRQKQLSCSDNPKVVNHIMDDAVVCKHTFTSDLVQVLNTVKQFVFLNVCRSHTDKFIK